MKKLFILLVLLVVSTINVIPQKMGDAYRFNINNLNIPTNRVGTIADVNIPPDGTLGRFGNGTFLFSSGFFMSGLTNGNLWAFAQASASLIENMIPGTVESGPNDPRAQIYKIRNDDIPFGQSWQDWIDAVALGADFYDGNGDGEYNPIDLNGNGVWDPDEDMPDLLGDETAWCVYWDGQPGAQRTRFAGVDPQGIEIRQTMFAYALAGEEGNIIFLRYRISNSGLVAERLDSVIFSVWADPDLGEEFMDDLVGVDVSRNAGFTYNGDDYDPQYGSQIPSFFMDFLSGPAVYIPGETFIDNDGDGIYTPGIDDPLDTAFTHRGQVLGIAEFPGAKNLDVSSFIHYIQSDPLRGDPNDEFEARHYGLGRLKLGELLDPCNDPWGGVFGGVNCSTVDPLFWYSGDPVTNVGWINTGSTDQRQMTNIGPFTLEVGKEIDIFVAYIVGQGTDPLNSITVTKELSNNSQILYDLNFDVNNVPIELTSFTATSKSGNVTLNWTTATENNNLGFEIERKINRSNVESQWIRIGFVEGSGTTTEIKNYNYVDDVTDLNANSLVYRLKQIDYDGSYEYSDEVFVEDIAPATYHLSQNYPNPFNPATTIKFSIPSSSFTTLKVYNELGEEVAVLLDKEFTAGTYEVEWNASGLPSGVYFYQLQSAGYVETKKMLLLK